MGDFIKPTQQRTKYTQADPFVNIKPQQAYAESLLGQSLGGLGGGVGNPYVGANPWQTGAQANLGQMLQQATPYYGTGLKTMEQVAGGGYLDPMAQAGFGNVAGDRRGLANAIFSTAMADPRSLQDPRGGAFDAIYASIPAQAQRARAQERVGLRTEADIAAAALGQYGAERQAQQAMQMRAAGLAPQLSQQVFGAGEKLRSAEQEANTAQLMANLRAQGLSQDAINQVVSYLDIAKGQKLGPVVGPVPAEQTYQTVSNVAKLYAGGAGA